MAELRPAELPNDLEVIRSLFREYVDGLGVNLDFQDFEGELATLPGKYDLPKGRLFIAWKDGNPVGCGALRPLSSSSSSHCEMKRLYVKPQARGEQLGRRLATLLCEEAKTMGYTRICLDSLPNMIEAQRLYSSLGFQQIEPYVFNPIQGTIFLGLDL